MTDSQKEKINQLHESGWGYKRIAAELGLPLSTVTSYCQKTRRTKTCKNCGKPIEVKPKRRPREFCSDACRYAWWEKHQGVGPHKIVRTFICPICGKEFTINRNRERKYCSRACFAVARRNAHD